MRSVRSARYRIGTAAHRAVNSWRDRPLRLRAPLFAPDRELVRIVERCRRLDIDPRFQLESFESHQPVLLGLLEAVPDARALELGMGFGSTPIVLGRSGRSLSLETDQAWFARFARFGSSAHRIEVWQDFDEWQWRCPYFSESWDVALVDNSPGTSRQSNLVALAATTTFIVCHDTQECFRTAASDFRWDFSSFRYVWTYTRFDTYTTVVSNSERIPLEALGGVAGQPPRLRGSAPST
jgi:hypothetical protein